MIQIKNLSAGYGGNDVIKNVSVSFEPGKITVLLGPNGSGKSTVLKAALGLIPISEGEIYYGEKEIRRMKRKEIAKKAAFLAQSRNVSSIQALRMVLHGRFPYLSYPRRYGKEDYEVARGAMDVTGCRAYEDRKIHELSGGQRQSVYLAMALAQDTKTVFMDEPTTYLDIGRQMQIMEIARTLADEGKAVVLVLHDLRVALQEADVVVLLKEGELVCVGSPDKIYESGMLKEVFGVEVHKMETPYGIQYYYISAGE